MFSLRGEYNYIFEFYMYVSRAREFHLQVYVPLGNGQAKILSFYNLLKSPVG